MVGLTDADVPAWTERLGLPGLFDIHVHFMPPNIMRRVWEYFDGAGPLIGRPWPITYRFSDEERVARLRALGVRRFSALPYAHKPGVAGYLNDWAAGFAEAVPEALRCATFYPEPDAAAYVSKAIDEGVELFKVHWQVGGFDPRDPLLDDVWGTLAETATPVVVHAGSGPVRRNHTGPGPFGEVLRGHPRLAAVVAHLGSPEYAEFLELAEHYENVRLDTTMAFTDFFMQVELPDGQRKRIAELEDRILFGSDFPNIPYSYTGALEALTRLDFGDDWLRAVCHGNAARIFGI